MNDCYLPQSDEAEILTTFRSDVQMQKIGRMGYQADEAEDYYREWFEKATVDAAQRASGYTPVNPIEEST